MEYAATNGSNYLMNGAVGIRSESMLTANFHDIYTDVRNYLQYNLGLQKAHTLRLDSFFIGVLFDTL